MRFLRLIPGLALAISTLAVRLAAQGAASPTDAARSFFAMLDAKRWADAAAMVDSASMSAVREADLSMMVAWAQHRAEIARAMHGKGSGGMAGYSSDGQVDPKALAKVGSVRVSGFANAPTLAEVAALPARTFLADVFEAYDTMFAIGPAGHPSRRTYTIVGEVIEADTIAHVLYRIGRPPFQAADPLQVNVLRFRRRGDRWLADLTLFDYEILGGGAMFMRMEDMEK